MTSSSAWAGALALLGAVGGFGLLGLLIGRDLERNGQHHRDNWHRSGGYPVDPSLPDRLHGPTPPGETAETAGTPDTAGTTDTAGAADTAADRLRGTLPAASDLHLGTLLRWTSSSERPSPKTSVPQAR